MHHIDVTLLVEGDSITDGNSALLRGFAQHKRTPGKPDDWWLPSDVYDEDRWTVDSLYLYVVSDGSVGGTLEDVDAVNMGDGCFSGYPAHGLTMR